MASGGDQTSLLKMSEEAVIRCVAESVKGLSATFCCGGSIPLQNEDNIRLHFRKVNVEQLVCGKLFSVHEPNPSFSLQKNLFKAG
jgi:hypothetical protein